MPPQKERRDSERIPCRQTCPYEMTTPLDSGTVRFSEGHGHAINKSVGGMLLLLPEQVTKRQVVEIHVPSEARSEEVTKLVEVCWTRPVRVASQVNMYLAGTRFVF